jgi:hypothetical protein
MAYTKSKITGKTMPISGKITEVCANFARIKSSPQTTRVITTKIKVESARLKNLPVTGK